MTRRWSVIFLALGGLLGCAGLANDINKGASTTERELMGEPRSEPPPQHTDGGSDGAVPLHGPDASGEISL